MKQHLRTVFFDVGGTLWSDRWVAVDDVVLRCARLAACVPGLSPAQYSDLLQLLDGRARDYEQAATLDSRLPQDMSGLISDALHLLALPADPATVGAVRRAMCLPAHTRTRLFPDAEGLLRTVRALGLRTVVVSNAMWRDAAAYRGDFDGFGVGHFVDRIITSVDVGYRKPHRAMFEAALEAANCAPDQCVMVGNSEAKDVQPAKALGMRAIRVAIEEPAPTESQADATVTSLADLMPIFRRWC